MGAIRRTMVPETPGVLTRSQGRGWRRGVRAAAMSALAALLIVALGGASTCQRKRDTKLIQELSDELCQAAQDFNKLVVWRHYNPVSLMVLPNRRIDFLMEAEKYGGAVQIEHYNVVICQVDETPPVREPELPSTDLPGEKDLEETPEPDAESDRSAVSAEEAVRAVEEAKVPSTETSLKETGIERKKGGKPSEKKVYYGTVLVRYINRTITPSNSVDTILVKQYWINVGDVWYCDFDWKPLIKR